MQAIAGRYMMMLIFAPLDVSQEAQGLALAFVQGDISAEELEVNLQRLVRENNALITANQAQAERKLKEKEKEIPKGYKTPSKSHHGDG